MEATEFDDFDALPSEGKIDVIYTNPGLEPKFVNIGKVSAYEKINIMVNNDLSIFCFKVAWETINALKPLHEAWAGGIELVPTSAYGVRFYQNGSSLVMHHDRVRI